LTLRFVVGGKNFAGPLKTVTTVESLITLAWPINTCALAADVAPNSLASDQISARTLPYLKDGSTSI
jgi:hypothetical protein